MHTPVLYFKVNGCELPGGEVLLVQPSDPSHKLRKNKHYGPASTSNEAPAELEAKDEPENPETIGKTDLVETTAPTEVNESKKEKEDDNDNLDDFFASLE
jgi:hypothetical protein